MQDFFACRFFIVRKGAQNMSNMHMYYVAVGDLENWKSAFAKGNVWGFTNGRKGGDIFKTKTR
jgi:hypothetical protein